MALRDFTIMIIRKRYISPYRKAKILTVNTETIKTKKKFMAMIEDKSQHWRDATYLLKDNEGIFARFDVKNGKVVNIYKCSPITDLLYPCWRCFK